MMSNLGLLLRTLYHLRGRQLMYQFVRRFKRIPYVEATTSLSSASLNMVLPVAKATCLSNDKFSFINISSSFGGWNDQTKGMLWAYNLNYMDWLGQSGLSLEKKCEWIDRFIIDLKENHIGRDPYPTALRTVNWVKFFSLHPEIRTSQRENALYSQLLMLNSNLEYHLLGNHLLEDAYALFIGSLYFVDKKLYDKASSLLYQELNEQVLADGAHYEQSPMYHCILLDRLLDAYNVSVGNIRFDHQQEITSFLQKKAELMLGHLEEIIYSDGNIPLFNDSAFGIAPSPLELFNYAKRLKLSWTALPLGECGYRKMKNNIMEALIDVGNITASYQCGHSHADTFNYELRLKGNPYIIDTGISTYNKDESRLYERSTFAHNTVTIDNCNSSEVWSGFRMGKRATVNILKNEHNHIVAVHDGFGKKKFHKRSFIINENSFEIKDEILEGCMGISRIHLSEHETIVCITGNIIETSNGIIDIIEGASDIKVTLAKASTAYSQLKVITKIELYFKNSLTYLIQSK